MRLCRTTTVYICSIIALLLSAVLCSTILDEDRSTLLETLEKELYDEHRRYQADHHTRLLSMDTTPTSYRHLRESMKHQFSSLSTPTLTHERDLPLYLSNINEIRRAGYRFTPDIDPGLHLKFGERWAFEKHGPYPATRLAQGAFVGAGAGTGAGAGSEGRRRARVEVELENAKMALDKQSLLDIGALSSDARVYSGLSAFTDDVRLLRSAVEYHGRRLHQEAREFFGDAARREGGRVGSRKLVRVA